MKCIKFLILLCLFIYGSIGEAQEITYTPYWHQINTPHGHIKLGPNNTSWAHIYTDRPAFIFDKPVYSHGGQFSAYSNSNLTLQTAGTTRMTILKSNGNVGIGTSNPSEKLEVAGNTVIRGASPYITLDNENYSSNKWRLYANIGGVHAGGFSFNEVVSGSNNYRMVIKPGGNIGIGTTNPQNKLDVKGTIRAEEVKVETGWADYVFHEDYELIPLSEVSTYIQENHHLPGIPTAEEVAENGIKLGEMNAKLLEKVEELTLYLIEMKEENEQQNKKIEALQKENEIIKNLLNK